jgi:hypothetical protein
MTWKKGMPSANPGGRGHVRNKLQTVFLHDLAEAWERDGKAALKIMAAEEPAKFVQACLALIPREVSVDVSGPLSGMPDEELQAAIQSIRQLRADAINGVAIDAGAPAMKVISDARKTKN